MNRISSSELNLEARSRTSIRAGFWLSAVLAAAALLFAGGVMTAQTQLNPDDKPRPSRVERKKCPEAGSLLLLGSSLLSAGGVLLFARRKKNLNSE
jgi:LPXTG-motif cell wall-anchored protein